MKNTISINNKILEVPYQYLTPYIRNSSYLNFTDPVVTDEKMIGLFAIYETGNYCVITANGAFSINYGDGTATQNYVSGTKAEYNIPYTNIAGNTDVGISTSQACTFTTGTNLVTLTNHNWENLQTISFSTINTTTGISIYTKYWISNVTTNTFQLSTTPSGAIVTLTSNGTGAVYIPQYRQAIITLTMQIANNLTKLVLSGGFTGSNNTYCTQWIDISIAGSNLTDLRIAAAIPGVLSGTRILHNQLEQFKLIKSNLKQAANLLHLLQSLKSVYLNFSQTVAVSYTTTLTTGTNLITTPDRKSVV